jgi:excisionase family DNA binding protein
VIRPLRSCPDSFGCVHIHFDDTPLPLQDPALRGGLDPAAKPVDEDGHATLTLTIPETAELLGISLSKAYEAARLGQIPTIRLGTRILVSRRRLEEMVNARK